MHLATIGTLYEYQDWARDRLMAVVEPLDDGKLDRAFEIGPGSIRATVGHLYASEWLWLARWKGRAPVERDVPKTFPSMPELWRDWRNTADERNVFLDTVSEADLDKPISYTSLRGERLSFKLAHMLLHVVNHGTHHRAQALNMLRHVGVEPPDLDLLRMLTN